jgi:hypothetical protein
MKKEVKQNAVELIKTLIRTETSEIETNRRQINRLADKNAMLKRIRAKHTAMLREFEGAKP